MKLKIEKILEKYLEIDEEGIDKLSLAINDISNECNELVGKIIPDITNSKSRDSLIINLWELREAITHIEYHIHDAELLTLDYIKE
jgi:hypothetical protein